MDPKDNRYFRFHASTVCLKTGSQTALATCMVWFDSTRLKTGEKPASYLLEGRQTSLTVERSNVVDQWSLKSFQPITSEESVLDWSAPETEQLDDSRKLDSLSSWRRFLLQNMLRRIFECFVANSWTRDYDHGFQVCTAVNRARVFSRTMCCSSMSTTVLVYDDR